MSANAEAAYAPSGLASVMIVPTGSLRIFPQVRTLHLVDLNGASPRPTLFFETYYEAQDRSLPADWRKVGLLGALIRVWRHPPATLELWEPAWPGFVARWLAIALVFRIRVGGAGGSIGLYAIENGDLRASASSWRSLRAMRSTLVFNLLRFAVPRLVDRIAYGSPGARESYRLIAGPIPSEIIVQLRAARSDVVPAKRSLSAAFVGVVEPRKGVPELMRAWEHVETGLPAAHLTLVGGGRLADEVAAWASAQPQSRTYAGVVPREQVLEILRESSVLVSPSQRHNNWREQIGGPNIEALSQGCTVVTTDETGIAAWLAERGHHVVPASQAEAMLPDAITSALRRPLDPSEVIAALPDVDGRIQADRWLHGRV